jgi:hypothetical protein
MARGKCNSNGISRKSTCRQRDSHADEYTDPEAHADKHTNTEAHTDEYTDTEAHADGNTSASHINAHAFLH